MAGTALVTGASRGLGAAIAKELANSGWSVAVNVRNDRAGAENVVDTIRTSGGRAALAQFDVTDPGAIEAGMAAIERELGKVDLIVNNAIGVHDEVDISDQNWELFLGQLIYCVKAPLLLAQAVLPEWKRERRGRIIYIGSEGVRMGMPRMAHYVAAKGAMTAMTRSWARDLGPFGITVNEVAPGWIPVERHQHIGQETWDHLRGMTPLGRIGVPDDIAGAVAFLASDKASFITGQTLVVSGGVTFG